MLIAKLQINFDEKINFMQFLVTGATGLIGNRLTEILLENGHGVSILTRRNQKSKNNNIR